MARINAFFQKMIEHGASDLHMSVGSAPLMRLHGDIVAMQAPTLTVEMNQSLLYELLNERQRIQFEENGDLDFAYEMGNTARLRANFFINQRGPAAVFRLIPSAIPRLQETGLPMSIQSFCERKNGLVLVAGPTGCGKSTTLAAMINHINETRAGHILTIEDPIEFLHPNKRALVSQREIETHTNSFATALRAALREDPDVILVGEMRDLETIELALAAAETGHLVFGTLHTNSAVKSIDRVVGVFPHRQQEQIRSMLADSLLGVISQRLVKRSDRPGRIPVSEVMFVTPAISNLIREAKPHQIKSLIQTNRRLGMQTMDQCLAELLSARKITAPTAYAHAEDKQQFQNSRRQYVSSMA